MNQPKKKIVFTVINDLSYDRRMDRICKTLSNNGYEVTLIGRSLKKSIPLIEKDYKQKRIKCFFNKGILFYLEYNWRLFWLLLFSSFDCYGAIDLDTILPHFFCSKLKRKIMTYDAHEYFTEVIEIQNRSFVKAVWKNIEKFTLKASTKAYTVSNSYARLFHDKYKTDFEIIRNVPPLKPTSSVSKPDVFTFIYIGAVNEGRGLEESIEAIKGLPAKLKICGDGDILNRLKSDLSEDQKEQVSFTGYLPPHELEAEALKAHVGLLLLKSESQSYYYSLANKFFDYIQAEIPQIVIDFPEYQTICKKHPVALISSLNPTEIRKQMVQLIDNQVLYLQIKAETVLAKKIYCWESEEKKLIYFYNNLWKKD